MTAVPGPWRWWPSTLAGVDEIASVFEDVPGAGRTRVLTAGAGREPLLFVHGWPACARVFWPLLTTPALRARFRMLAPDLFGFGRSTLRAPRLTFAHQVDAVRAVARRAGRPCLAVGTSFGARVLLQAAATTRRCSGGWCCWRRTFIAASSTTASRGACSRVFHAFSAYSTVRRSP